jgi:hypothetical protein
LHSARHFSKRAGEHRFHAFDFIQRNILRRQRLAYGKSWLHERVTSTAFQAGLITRCALDWFAFEVIFYDVLV